MALAITKPIICPYCSNVMTNYSNNNTTRKIDFHCRCGKITSFTEEEYKQVLRSGKFSRTSN